MSSSLPLSSLAPRSKVIATNTLVCLFPPNLFSPALLPLFKAHFESYGHLEQWTPLERLGRVLVVYDSTQSATAARREMDGFVWDDDDDELEPATEAGEYTSRPLTSASTATNDDDAARARSTPQPLRAFFGPSLSLPLSSPHQTLLAVPALSRNFLISPPGSPPVGWEQTLEEAPNRSSLPEDPDDEGATGWGDELARALRFLSVSSNDVDGDEDEAVVDSDASSTTHTIANTLKSGGLVITVSTPPQPSSPSPGTTSTPPPGAAKITAVKATIESMLGRKKSFGDLGAPSRVIIPTARPPTQDEVPYLA
ncbi:hypothetical protein P7C70_g569, partial [Phenoliferia sp. Uapishka_3]